MASLEVHSPACTTLTRSASAALDPGPTFGLGANDDPTTKGNGEPSLQRRRKPGSRDLPFTAPARREGWHRKTVPLLLLNV